MKIVSVSEMIAIEKEANLAGLTYAQMMKNAGEGLAKVIDSKFNEFRELGILGFIGSGNNGGDALVALTRLRKIGWRTKAYLVRYRDESDPQLSEYTQSGGEFILAENDQFFHQLTQEINQNILILDGILGTGIRLPLSTEIANILKHIKSIIIGSDSKKMIVAVDTPSGLDCDTGNYAPETISADLTITMAAVKEGLLTTSAYPLVGEIILVDIGLPTGEQELESWRNINKFTPDPAELRSWLAKRPIDAHKGTFGTTLIVAGSVNYSGAPLLSGETAYRSGTGLVTIAIPSSIHSVIAGQLPEATWILLDEKDGCISETASIKLWDHIPNATSILIGPGFGLENTTENFILNLLEGGSKEIHENNQYQLPPSVIDADGLKLLSRIPDWHRLLPDLSILTPHPGEMAIMCGLDKSIIQSNRLKIAIDYSKKWNHILVLKGALTVVANPDGRCALIPIATPSLARAGTGDVLAGLIAGLVSQKIPPFEAAILGAWIHANAGLEAARMIGNSASVLASDVSRACVSVLNQLYVEPLP
jgi:hydroxyethylthiazole kinase-like uncharacterized protein yjeF